MACDSLIAGETRELCPVGPQHHHTPLPSHTPHQAAIGHGLSCRQTGREYKAGAQIKASDLPVAYPPIPYLPPGAPQNCLSTQGKLHTRPVTTVITGPVYLPHQEVAAKDTECWTSALLRSPCRRPLPWSCPLGSASLLMRGQNGASAQGMNLPLGLEP